MEFQPLAPGAAGPTPLKLAPWDEIDPAVALDYHVHTTHTDGKGSVAEMAAAAPLGITTSADLSLDKRFDVIVNSVSPEFASSSSDSGINLAVWRTLTGYTGEGDKPPPVRYEYTHPLGPCTGRKWSSLLVASRKYRYFGRVKRV